MKFEIDRSTFYRYWLAANTNRIAELSQEEIDRLVEYHWQLLLACRPPEQQK